jgi:tRNA wybutosine-synthesizing protein 2
VPRPGPIERLRRRLAARIGADRAALLPVHYQRVGSVVIVRWPEALRPQFKFLGAAAREELGVATVLRVAGPVEGAWRLPRFERLAGDVTTTEVLEDGLRYRFDAAKILYSRGNREERVRWARSLAPGERVIDLFAGIGYFALPAARHGLAREVIAVEEHPLSYAFLVENVRRNRLEGVVRPVLGDNRIVELPFGGADRVLLGYLPDALPWVHRAVPLLARTGGQLDIHRLAGSRDPADASSDPVLEAVVEAGRSVAAHEVRVVKSYGPGREHRVVHVRLAAVPRSD